MDIIGTEWGRRVNHLILLCKCGVEFKHRADRWRAFCPHCGASAPLHDVRHRYLQDRMSEETPADGDIDGGSNRFQTRRSA